MDSIHEETLLKWTALLDERDAEYVAAKKAREHRNAKAQNLYDFKVAELRRQCEHTYLTRPHDRYCEACGAPRNKETPR